jgi:anti-sigma-K factor RskA
VTAEERQELLAGYALGTLSEPDARAAERLVRSDADAAAELASYHEIVDLIALSAPLRRADPALRERVLRAARRGTGGVSGWQRARRQLAASAGWAAAAAAVLAAAIWINDMQGDIDRLRDDSAALNAVVQATAKQVDALAAVDTEDTSSRALALQLQQALAEQQAMAAIGTDPDATTTTLNSAPAAAGVAAIGHYRYSESAGAGLLIAYGLPELPIGEVYQVWLEDSLRAVSGGVFFAPAGGDATVLVETEAQLLPIRVSVRVAPQGGDSAPNGLLVLSGDIER